MFICGCLFVRMYVCMYVYMCIYNIVYTIRINEDVYIYINIYYVCNYWVFNAGLRAEVAGFKASECTNLNCYEAL